MNKLLPQEERVRQFARLEELYNVLRLFQADFNPFIHRLREYYRAGAIGRFFFGIRWVRAREEKRADREAHRALFSEPDIQQLEFLLRGLWVQKTVPVSPKRLDQLGEKLLACCEEIHRRAAASTVIVRGEPEILNGVAHALQAVRLCSAMPFEERDFVLPAAESSIEIVLPLKPAADPPRAFLH